MPSEPDFYGPWPKLPQDQYEPRSPSSEVLFQVVRDNLDEFLETVSLGSDGHGLPSFVEDELRAFISCGDLRGGFARFRCRTCGFERLLPFSCKGRGFCPLCFVVSYLLDFLVHSHETTFSGSKSFLSLLITTGSKFSPEDRKGAYETLSGRVR